MSNEVTINDLPDEMLETILFPLSLKDRKSALLVSQRWSALKLFDMSLLRLAVHKGRSNDEDYQEYHQTLLASSRPYKHISIAIYCDKYDLIADIVRHFSQSVESMEFHFHRGYVSIPLRTENFIKITAPLSNLKQLYVSDGFFDPKPGDWTLPVLDNLEEVHFESSPKLAWIPNMPNMMPNLTKVDMTMMSGPSAKFLRHFSQQLLDLKIVMRTYPYTMTIGLMTFPLLEKATITYINTEEFLGILREPPENLHSLSLLGANFDPDGLQAICKLKNLKTLEIHDSNLFIPVEFNFPPLEGLHMLSLKNDEYFREVQFYRFYRHAFPNIAVLEIVLPSTFVHSYEYLPFQHHEKVCRNWPSLKRLILNEPKFRVQLVSFLKFCAFSAPRELHIKCSEIYDDSTRCQFPRIPVDTLILELSTIRPLDLLHKMLRAMGELKRLELIFPSDGLDIPYIQPEMMQSLRDAFPRCDIVQKSVKQPGWKPFCQKFSIKSLAA